MSRHTYYTDALAFAEANGYTPQQVAGASYRQMCNVLDFDPDDCPSDFLFRQIRRQVATELWKRKNDADDAALRAKIRSKILELVEMAGASITKLKAGESAEETGWLITR